MGDQRINSGILSRNKDRQKETHAEFKGSLNVEGKEYWLSGWTKTAQQGPNAGGKFFSLTVQPKEERGAQQSDRRQAPPKQGQGDEEIPF